MDKKSSKRNSKIEPPNFFITLTPEELSKPENVIKNFFDCYSIEDIQEVTWEWLTAAITKAPSIYDNARERSNLIFFYECLIKLIGANVIHFSISPSKVGMTDDKLHKIFKGKAKKLERLAGPTKKYKSVTKSQKKPSESPRRGVSPSS
jgi:hypothetical protein